MRPAAALLAGGLLLAATQAHAEGGPRPESIAAFVAAVAAAGCVLTQANQSRILRASGLSQEVAAGVVQRLEEDGRMVAGSGDRLVLKTGGCA